METHSQLEQRGDPSAHVQPSARRRRNARKQLEQSALARSVLANDAQALSRFEGEAHVLESRNGPMPGPAREHFTDSLPGAVVEPVDLGQAIGMDEGLAHDEIDSIHIAIAP